MVRLNNDLTRRLTLGAMMIALYIILLAVTVYVPLIGLVTVYFVPLPIVWYSAKYSRSSSIYVAVISIIMSILIGGIGSLPLAFLQVPLGLVLGDAIRRKQSKLYMFMATGLTILITIVLEYIAMVKFFNVNIVAEVLAKAREFFNYTLSLMDQLGQLDKKTEQAAHQMFTLFESSVPAGVILSAFFLALIYLLLYPPILRRLGIEVPKFENFTEMKLPKSVLWYYLLVLLLMLTNPEPGTFLFMVTVNASIILRMLLFIQGIAFIHYVIHEYKWPVWATVIATIVAFPLQGFVVMLGIFDLGFNIRSFVSNSTRK